MVPTVVAVAAGLLVMWLAFILFVWVIRPGSTSLSDATRL
jgi:predicted tellurium resistance membrane protein TerC